MPVAMTAGVSDLLTMLSVLSGTGIPALEERFVGAGYGDLGKEASNASGGFVEPFQERVNTLMSDTKVGFVSGRN